jgi:hypothetical protein
MDYTVTRQLGAILLNQSALPGEPIASTAEASFYTNPNNFLGVKKHDDDFVELVGGSDNMDSTSTTCVTVEKIDLRSIWGEGMVLDDIMFNIQRAYDLPRVLNLYNYDPTADIWETLLITTDQRIGTGVGGITDPRNMHYGGFQDCDDEGGLGFLNEVLYASTRIYGADPSRKFTGDNFASYSDDETLAQTYLNGTLAYEDSVVRGYAKLISAPAIYVYRIVTSWYSYRSPASLSQIAIDNFTTQLQMVLPPIAVTVEGNMRKGSETERIKYATDTLLQQPARPAPSRP